MTSQRMPSLFVGHGSPMNAIEDNTFSRKWIELGQAIPRPKGIICISAHWETRGSYVTAVSQPRTIYDFYGFPPELYEKTYPAPGSPELAGKIQKLVTSSKVELDDSWGLDHGTWSVLCRMYPKAEIPVVQLSLDRNQGPEHHYQVGQELAVLREEGILILGSGNLVHNLRLVQWDDKEYDWAVEFDSTATKWILNNEHEPLIHYENAGRAAALSINSAEHFLPLLFVLGTRSKEDKVTLYNEKVTMGSISMRCVEFS